MFCTAGSDGLLRIFSLNITAWYINNILNNLFINNLFINNLNFNKYKI